MIMNLSAGWFFVIVAIVLMSAFFMGSAMDGVMGRQGFGLLGNMVVLTSGFVIGLYVGDIYGVPLSKPGLAVACGLGGAFLSLATLAVMKRLILRD